MTWGIFKKDTVSEAYKKMKGCATEELKGNQHKLDVNKNGKVDGDDLAKLRATKEEVEKLDEYESKDGVYKHAAKPGRYGGSEKESDYVKGPSDAELKKIEAKKKSKAKMEELDIFSEKELDMLVNEVLSKDQPAGKWISDFVKSDDPKFAGDTKKQRIKRALGAYYAAQRNESTDYEDYVVLDEEKQSDIVKMDAKSIKHANMKDKQQDADVMEPHSEGEADFLDQHSVIVTDDPAADGIKTGADKVSRASEPRGKGPGSYDAKEKLGSQKASVKEGTYKTAAGEEIDTEPSEKDDDKDDKAKASKKGNAVK